LFSPRCAHGMQMVFLPRRRVRVDITGSPQR